jgi:hypothetical protein
VLRGRQAADTTKQGSRNTEKQRKKVSRKEISENE